MIKRVSPTATVSPTMSQTLIRIKCYIDSSQCCFRHHLGCILYGTVASFHLSDSCEVLYIKISQILMQFGEKYIRHSNN